MPTWKNGEMMLLMYPLTFSAVSPKCMEISINGIELIKRYFKQNNNYTFDIKNEMISENSYRHNMYITNYESITMGYKATKTNIILFKTFFSYDMCKNKQVDTFFSE